MSEASGGVDQGRGSFQGQCQWSRSFRLCPWRLPGNGPCHDALLGLALARVEKGIKTTPVPSCAPVRFFCEAEPMQGADSPADVILVNPHYIRRHGGGVVPPIGLCYLASALESQDANVRVLDLAARFPDFGRGKDSDPIAELEAELELHNPALIGIGPLVTATLGPAASIAAACRALTDAAVVLGGPLCAVPGAAARLPALIDFDWLVAGDGERPIVELWKRGKAAVGAAASGASDPLPWREPNLDSLSVPARQLLDGVEYASSLRRALGGSAMTSAFLSRGCPYSCSFCAAPLSSGRKVRRFSMSRVQSELDACAKLGFGEIIFYDDCLFVRSPKLESRVAEFCNALEGSSWHGSYQLELRCDAVVAMSEGSLRRLADTGCRQINMGIEKGQARALDAIRKRLTPDIAESAVDRVVRSGIRAAGTFILGGPDEGPDDLEATIDFATALDLDFAHFNPLALYPGTSLFDQVYPDAEWLALCRDPDLAPFGDILWRSDDLPLERVIEAVDLAYDRFYSTSRLVNAVGRALESERHGVAVAYERLSRERATSWRQPPKSEGAAA
jgi:anaerobic magnesium-protoporphyrin IX monomethyl ester cyclase